MILVVELQSGTLSCIVELMSATLLKGLHMLEVLARSDRSRELRELAEEMDIPKSTLHRTLNTLINAGYVKQDSSGRYGCTLKIFELGACVTDKLDVRRMSAGPMEELARTARETVHLATLDFTDVIYLDKVDSQQPIQAYSRVGGRAPAYCVASGKALLAHQRDGYLEHFPDSLPEYTVNSLKTKVELAEELYRIRGTGYSFNNGEWQAEVGGVATILLNHEQRPIAAVGVSGPLDRIKDNLSFHVEKVSTAANNISTALGCRGYGWTPLEEG